MAVEQSSTLTKEAQDLSQIIRIDEVKVCGHSNDLVRKTVQETLNEKLDAEAQPSSRGGYSHFSWHRPQCPATS